MAVRVDSRHLGRVGVEEALLQVLLSGLERSAPQIDVEEDLVGQAAGDSALAELPLRVHCPIELVGIARQVGIVSDCPRIVLDSAGSGARYDRR